MKKQLQIINWNIRLNGLKLDLDLEATMLSEESAEFMDAYRRNHLVDMIDAYCDFIFVLRGSQAKVANTQFHNAAEYTRALDMVTNATNFGFVILEILLKTSGIDINDVDVCLQFVIDENEKKCIVGEDGKVTKSGDWKDPKYKIEKFIYGERLQCLTKE